MITKYQLINGKLAAGDNGQASVLLYVNPSEAEKKQLTDEFQIDPHNIASSLDPNELGRMEYEPGHTVFIIKRPKRYSREDQFLLKVLSIGLFVFPDKLVVITTEEAQLLEGRQYQNLYSINVMLLKVFHTCILHFEQHLQVINKISDELEEQINRSTDNKHLIYMFNMGKSLVYYQTAVRSNGRVMEKMKSAIAKLGFGIDEQEFLEDILIENTQCFEQADVHSQVLATLMDARVSIVSNNLNLLIKRLTIYMISIMVATLVVSLFSMNVTHPFSRDTTLTSFWIILGFSVIGSVGVMILWRIKKW